MTARRASHIRILSWLGLLPLVLSSVLVPANVFAQSAPATVDAAAIPALVVESRDNALHLQWQGGVQSASTGEAAHASGSEGSSYGGYLLPVQTVMVELPAAQAQVSAAASVAVEGMSSTPYTGELTPAPQALPPALDYEATPTNTPYVGAPHLPSSPVFVVTEGWQRGRHLAVIGFSPIYQDPATGEVLAVEAISANIAGASLAEESDATADPSNAALFSPSANLAGAPGPTNKLANSNAYKILVSDKGIQQLSGSELKAAGLNAPTASTLHLTFKGSEIPLDIIDKNDNNKVDDGDYIRFYAFSDGDAWNAAAVYWLSAGGGNGLRMEARPVAPAGAPLRTTAFEAGQYQHSSVYETTLAGADGDNWFQANLKAVSENAAYEVDLPHQLPLNGELPTILNVNLTAYALAFSGPISQSLKISNGAFNYTDRWTESFPELTPFHDTIRTVTLEKAADAWTITLLYESYPTGIMLDAIDYLLPVQLNFGGKGATLQGAPDATYRYRLTNTPTNTPGGRGLYDISNPGQPQRLSIPTSANFDFQDDASHRYVMTGEGTLFTPFVQAHEAINLGAAGAAHEVYIAPAQFAATLKPLIDLRKSQGYQAKVVDVQDIYDAWSYGMVDAKAIRSFLRYTNSKWNPAPLAAVLVGDGTWDPLDFTGVGNPNIIPPYIADVDLYLKYVPCESCFGQLDGEVPDADYMIDVWIGRFPVIDVAELTTVVNKIVRYETDDNLGALWRTTSLQLVDDDVRPDNSVDDAGPFIESAEGIIKLMPASVRQLRNYFMAATDLSNVEKDLRDIIYALIGWFISDPDAALARSISQMNSGVGIVTYTGHANHWQWARIVRDGEQNKWLFGLWEVLQLRNVDSPFISLSMTCYTSQFHIPAQYHFTVDEHLFLHGNGGAIATWGPTGLSEVPVHDLLQRGFHQKLWKSPPFKAKLGALTQAGYEAILKSNEPKIVNKTFAFLGDPLTSARVTDIDAIYLPILSNE